MKRTTLPKAIYRLSAIPIKLPMTFFTELEQKLYNLYGNTKDPIQPKRSWERENGAAGIKFPDFALSHGATAVFIKMTHLYCVRCCFSLLRLFVTPWTAARQASLSMELPRQEYWSGLPCPPPGGLPDPGIEPASLMSRALTGEFFTTGANWEAPITFIKCF